MSNSNTKTLEHEAETARSQFARTAENLRGRFTPSHLLDESIDYLRHSDGAVAVETLRRQVRQNPLPLALVGAGFAWFLLGGGPDTRSIRHGASARARGMLRRDDHDDDDYYEEEYDLLEWENEGFHDPVVGKRYPASSEEGNGSGVGDKARAARASAGRAASSMGETASSAASGAAGTVGDSAAAARDSARNSVYAARERAYRTGRGINRRAGRVGRSARETFSDLLEREPLVIGALGIALGAAIGAMLPGTRTEDEYLGPYRDRARDKASRGLEKGAEEAKGVAAKAYGTVKEEAGKQGLGASDGKETVASRASKAAKSAARKTESDVRGRVGQSGSGSTTGSSAEKSPVTPGGAGPKSS